MHPMISVEVSLYPLTQEYKPIVKAFIRQVSANTNLNVRVNGISTQIFGTLDEVMPTLQKAIASCFDEHKAAVVIKILPTDLSAYEYRG